MGFPIIFAWSYKAIDQKFKTRFLEKEMTEEEHMK
jgi:hypothetical protein